MILLLNNFNFAFRIYIIYSIYNYFIISFAALWFQILNDIGNNYLKLRQRSFTFVILSFSKLILAIIFNIYFIIYKGIGVLGIFISTLLTSMLVSLVLIIPIIFKTGLHFSWQKIKGMIKE